MSDNVLRRLKEQTPYTNVLDGELMKDAASAIEALRAENEKLRAALKPFAARIDGIPSYVDEGRVLPISVSVGDLRAAKAALGESDD